MISIQGKRILLLYAHFFGYDTIVKKKLEDLGASVDLYDARANIGSIEKAIRKVDASLYYYKQRKFHDGIMKINAEKKYDFIFCNDILGEKILLEYRNVYPNATMVLYLDDSVRNMKGVENTFKYFNRVLTFDKKDSEAYSLLFRPLFFSDVFLNRENECIEEYDISFVGTCHSDRLKIINYIRDNYPSLKKYFFCYLQSWFMFYFHYFLGKEYRKVGKGFFQFHSLSMKDVSDVMRKSKCILDIQHPNQTGLTMRTIETLGAKKKLITTNIDVMKYDFYDPCNVLVIDRDYPIINEAFLNEPVHTVSESVLRKYTLEGWIDDVFRT